LSGSQVPSENAKEIIAVLASGGLDSCIMVSELLRQRRPVQPLYVRSNLVWEQAETRSLRRYLQTIHSPSLRNLVVLDLPLTDLYGEHWSTSGEGTPTSESPDEDVFLPGRNALLVVKAAVWCQLNDVCELALAPLGTSPFADTTQQFFDNAEAMFNCYAERKPLRIVLPFSQFNKRDVMERGREYPLELTFSCISPKDGLHCGCCNKCAERQQAFRQIGLEDPTRYAA
jgi:7-cyano-7-deazaguanine synthase